MERARKTPSWVQTAKRYAGSIQGRFLVGFLLVLMVLTGTTSLVVATQLRPLLVNKNVEIANQTGAAMVVELGQRIAMAETLAQAIAHAAENLPLDEEMFHQIIPNMFEFEGLGAIIAGGGVWPEPYLFDPALERRAFFWGRGATGELKYFDDYNTSAAGYHHEEWYVPARILPHTGCVWSRSYMDPHSREPMVTCSTAYHRDGALAGVVTVDLRLADLAAFFAQATRDVGGYAFAVDHNNQLLSFPDRQIATVDRATSDGAVLNEYIGINTLAERAPGLRQAADYLTAVNDALVDDARNRTELRETEARIALNSYQINNTEAALISALYAPSHTHAEGALQAMEQLELDSDIVLGEPVRATVFDVPQTHWKVILVTPTSTAIASANAASRQVILALLIVVAVATAAWQLAVGHYLVTPIRRTAQRLRAATCAGADTAIYVNDVRDDELGDLLKAFNSRTHLAAAAREELEREVDVRRKAESASRAAQKRAEEACRLQAEFVANMSHEVRTPLHGLLGMANVLAKTDMNKRNLSYVDTITSCGESLLSILNNIMDISKIEAGGLTLDRSAFHLGSLVRHSTNAAANVAAKNGVALTRHVHTDLADYYEGDAKRIGQIITNLADNAVKFTERGEVKVSVQETSRGRLRFCVTDTGPGIPKDKLSAVFERFRQLDGSHTRKHGGTGLGLPICRELVKAMSGKLGVRTKVGVGSVFWFDIPLPASTSDAMSHLRETDAPPSDENQAAA